LVVFCYLSHAVYKLNLVQAYQSQYLYDDQGRLTSAIDGTGATAVYNYDAVGNLLSIDRLTLPGSGIGICLVSPVMGPVTQLCRLQGYGVDPIASNNVVKFNGVSATVSSATAYTLTVVVPAGASTRLFSPFLSERSEL
jgi:YD repeat-containing protein